jgi:hypothetical protein
VTVTANDGQVANNLFQRTFTISVRAPVSLDARVLGAGAVTVKDNATGATVFSGSADTIRDLNLVPGNYQLLSGPNTLNFTVSPPAAGCTANAQGQCCGIVTLP